jgi:hypothetical protein
MPAGSSVFNGNVQTINGVIKAEDVKLKINKNDAIGAIVQRAQWSLERTVNMLYEIGTQNVYYVGDRRRGQAQFERVVGGSKTFVEMVKAYGDLCKANDNTMALSAGATSCAAGGSALEYNLLGVTLQSLGASVTANDIVVSESMGFMFVDMEYGPPAGAA